MRWGKFVLLFQAVVTLILGIIFFLQVLTLDSQKISQTEITINTSESQLIQTNISDIRTRFSTASYILLFVSLIELIIITRLLT